MMSREEQLQGSRSALSYSPSRGSPARPRLYGSVGTLQRQQQLQRSISSGKKPPEPLRRAVADCLSSSTQNVHGNPSAVSSEAARTLRVGAPSLISFLVEAIGENPNHYCLRFRESCLGREGGDSWGPSLFSSHSHQSAFAPHHHKPTPFLSLHRTFTPPSISPPSICTIAFLSSHC
ncbi:hypothetical protein Taro_006374 [Colocasia esculenta]|uniref:Uncharacterized protein n=1 Tax=Colocasia esculenta TaxID=4460 RepID=A0A843TSH9_COLES|nr:hypothetical protein [Colocasia esculenta]